MINAVIEELKTHQTQLDQDGVMVGVSRQALEELLAHIAKPAQPAPIAGLEPVQETWFSDRALPVLAMSGDVENDRALKLHFRRPVTDADRRDLTDALNLHIQHSRGQLYTRAQLEAHAAEQVRPLVEALEGLIEAVELDADEGLEGIGSYTGARLTDAKNAIRARGQV